MYHFPFLFLANKLQTFTPLINYSPIVYNQLIGQICMLQSLYTTFQTSLLLNFREVFLVFLVIHGYLSSLFT